MCSYFVKWLCVDMLKRGVTIDTHHIKSHAIPFAIVITIIQRTKLFAAFWNTKSSIRSHTWHSFVSVYEWTSEWKHEEKNEQEKKNDQHFFFSGNIPLPLPSISLAACFNKCATNITHDFFVWARKKNYILPRKSRHSTV